MKKKVILIATFAIVATTGALFAYNKVNSNCNGSCCGNGTCQTKCTCDDSCSGENCICGCSCSK